MNNFTILNYQGSKNNLSNFIIKNLEPYMQDGKAFFDIFSGSASVSNMFRDSYQIFANDTESYASIIADAILNQPKIDNATELLHSINIEYSNSIKELAKPIHEFIITEQQAIEEKDYHKLISVYNVYPTVWNNKYSNIVNDFLSVEAIRSHNDYFLFTTYYASNYYGISQSLDIDCLIKIIKTKFPRINNVLFCCLFYAMKEAVFSKDGHMAQPLSLEKNQSRLFIQREKNIFDLFIKKLKEYINIPLSKFSGKNKVFNMNFEDVLDEELFKNIGLVYADPPYTDMQYSRYYHLLNVAAQYNYPDLTQTKTGYTKGLYTEGRYQSKLSQRSSAKDSLETLIKFCAKTSTNLAISYAYPKDTEKQATDRYTVSIDELIKLAKLHFSEARVKIVTQDYNHANHRNKKQKEVIEYLILCGDKNLSQINMESLKNNINSISPTKNNVMYNSHMYWSQKAYNVCDILIDSLSNKGDVVFDPFLGSGVTTLEAIKSSLSRCAIGCDINDMPIFIVIE